MISQTISILGLLLSRFSPAGQAPDLDVIYIERTPRYPAYRINYDQSGKIGVPIIVNNKSHIPLTSAQAASVKRQPAVGDEVEFIAHVQNRGAAIAKIYETKWEIDGVLRRKMSSETEQTVGQEKQFKLKWKWQTGRHIIKFIADPLLATGDNRPQNNSRTDATDAWSLIWQVEQSVYEAFNRSPNLIGTTSFEDWAQWHIDHMNHLFDISPTPWDNLLSSKSYPSVRPRVRCDKVVVVNSVSLGWGQIVGGGMEPIDAGYDGAWSFSSREHMEEWAAGPDWGLIHEWGHQLGLPDLYALDRAGFQNLISDADGDPLLIGHRAALEGTMMHSHGPTTFSEECMGALMTQIGRRRGYYADHYFLVPKKNELLIRDRGGRPVADAKVTFWQDKDNIFEGKPIFGGTTNASGRFSIPNRPAPSITTERGYSQSNNPFGQINVVGNGDVFLVRIEARGHTDYVWMDITDFNRAAWRNPAAATYERQTSIPVISVLRAPTELTAERMGDIVRLHWKPSPGARTYRIYHAKPDEFKYQEVHTSIQDGPYADVPLGDGAIHRFAVTAVDQAITIESPWSNIATVTNFVRPWGIAVMGGGKRYIRDSAYGQAIMQKASGVTVGLVGSVHYHFEGSYDIAFDRSGRLLSAKMGDGYDPNPGFRVQDKSLNMVVDYRKPEGSEPGQFRTPYGIGANSKDHIFVADTGNNRIQEFTPNGKFVQIIGAKDLRLPSKIAFDSMDRMYVADSGHNRIAIFSAKPSGEYQLVKSLLGGIKEPFYVVVDNRDRVFVSTNRIAGVYMFDGINGPADPTWSFKGEPNAPLTGPKGMAFDGKGNLLIVDSASRTIITAKLPK